MFGLFKKKEPVIAVTDKVVIDATAKWKVMLDARATQPDIAFVFWFDESLREAEAFFSGSSAETIPLFTVRGLSIAQVTGKTIAFGEHYPLRNKEEELYARLGLRSVTVFSSLQEPLFRLFGSDKIIGLMKQLGMKEDEVVEHKMISNAIRNAQEKIGKKILVEQTGHSQEDWMKKNLPG